MTGLVRSSANAVNSFATQALANDPMVYPTLTSRPGVPNNDGMRTLNPASTTRCANSTTCGCRPGYLVDHDHRGTGATLVHGTRQPVVREGRLAEAGKLDRHGVEHYGLSIP